MRSPFEAGLTFALAVGSLLACSSSGSPGSTGNGAGAQSGSSGAPGSSGAQTSSSLGGATSSLPSGGASPSAAGQASTGGAASAGGNAGAQGGTSAQSGGTSGGALNGGGSTGCGDTTSDVNNCGSCGHVCSGTCQAGQCSAPLSAGAADAYPYVPDLGDGTYRNPIVIADYSDPDPILVGSDYYLVASSFNVTPGLPILHSKDLVNWTIVGHAIDSLPGTRFAQPQHGQGVWAPSIREHAGTYYIAFPNYCKPADDGSCAEEGIWTVSAPQPTGPWSAPHQLLAARGVIDPCLFWDDDGKAYLVHAYALSRAGISDRVDIRPMSVDAMQMLGTGQMVYSNPTVNPTLEGPKMYKRNGYYYILAPAGGVTNGWELALRSKTLLGPYDVKRVLEQGSTNINGPHQGGIVDTPDGTQTWFLHFQDAGVYGRILHLNPVTWTDDWPLMGVAGSGGIRQPVSSGKKPALPTQPIQIPQTSDDFSSATLGLQWQWHANYQSTWYSLSARPGYLRLFPQTVPAADLTQTPNLLMQKLPARSFNVDTTLELTGTQGASSAGLVLWGDPATALSVAESSGQLKVSLISAGKVLNSATIAAGTVRLRVAFSSAASARFSYAAGTGAFVAFPQAVTMAARKSSWIGAKVGLFAIAAGASPPGTADFSEFQFGPYAAP